MAFVLYPEFLTRQNWLAAIEYLCAREASFTPSKIYGPLLPPRVDETEARSLSLGELGDVGPRVAERVREVLPGVLESLGHAPFEIVDIEMGSTVYGHGGFFRTHHDGGVVRRPISFVYYCHREPRGFTGGELRIERDGAPDALITPQANAAVFFRSALLHEVMPVEVPSRRFSDSRLTIHGWIHRDAAR